MPDNLRVLFCADPLAPARVDEHFGNQATIVRGLGGQVAVIDHDALLGGDVDVAVRRVPRDSGPWWYRGWMMPTASYVELSNALERRGASLRVPPRRYRAAHELPGWYSTFSEVTPDSHWMAWAPGEVPTEQDVMALTGTLGPGPAVVKDFVKSRKHEWQEACYIPEAADLTASTAIVARMVELQEGSLNGGIVLRRFENYLKRDGRTVEARVWWVDGAPVMITAHPDTPDVLVEPDLSAVAPLVAAFGCPFVTTDVAQRVDGAWRVVEVGDGQVSDFPEGVDPTVLFQAMANPTSIDLPVQCPSCGFAGTPIMFGLPTPSARRAAADGALVLRGCLMPEDAPQWACPDGHEWSTSEAQWEAAIDAVIGDYENAA